MSPIDSLMTRLGYVKLGRYGLALTPQGRIISTQPSILDDGSGGRIVGWQRGDLAEMELATLPVGKAPAAPPPIPVAPVRTFAHTVPVAVVPAPRAVTPVVVAPTPAPVQVAKLALAGIAQFSAPMMPPSPQQSDDVAGEADDDDWDWQMAVARARAAADEVEAAVIAKPAPRAIAVTPPPAPLTAPTGTRVSPPPMPVRAPKMVAPVIRDSSMVPSRAPAKPAAPANVVPLRQASTAPSSKPAPLPPRRAARGTGQVSDDPATAKVAIAPAPARSASPSRPMPLAPPTEDTGIRPAPVRRAGPAPAASFPRIEPMPVEDTRPDTRTEIKPAPLPRFSTRFAAAR